MASILESTTKYSISLCRSCKTSRIHIRAFSASPSAMIGPESSDFIPVPTPVQPFAPRKSIVKGVLPVPRELFPPRRLDKPTKSYRDAATPEPSHNQSKVDKDHPLYETLEWRRRMAEIRRQNLREGLVELYQRKQMAEANIKRQSKARQTRQKRISSQPPREDERLTAASTVKDMKPKKNRILSDSNAEERLESSKAYVAMRQQMKSEERMDAIHTLYMNARNFIVTEEQLSAEIERVFPAGENPDWMNDQRAGENIWNLGAPPTVASLLKKEDPNSRWELVQGRTKKIAEALTGGKI